MAALLPVSLPLSASLSPLSLLSLRSSSANAVAVVAFVSASLVLCHTLTIPLRILESSHRRRVQS